jgi:hypothetical protein
MLLFNMPLRPRLPAAAASGARNTMSWREFRLLTRLYVTLAQV